MKTVLFPRGGKKELLLGRNNDLPQSVDTNITMGIWGDVGGDYG